MRLYLIRHPQPDAAAGVCYGTTDVAVASEQVHATALALAAQLPRQTPLYSSPLSRCARLAEELASLLNCSPPIYDSRLQEMHFGIWEAQRWNAIPRSEIDAWASDMANYRPGGGESVVETARRILTFAEELRAWNTESAIIVCHAGTMRLLLASRDQKDAEALALQAARESHRIDFGECIVSDY